MQQAVDTAEVHECAVVGDVLDNTLDDCAFLQRGEELFALFTHGLFEHGATRNNDVVALAIELDDLEFDVLAFERRGVLDRTDVDERTRQECADAVDHHSQATLDLAGDQTGLDHALFQRVFQIDPGCEALGLLAGQLGLAVAVFDAVDSHLNEVARLDVDAALIVLEFVDVDQAFGLQTCVDNDELVFNRNNLGGDHFTGAHFLAREAFLKEGGKTFHGRDCGSHVIRSRSPTMQHVGLS